MNDVKELQKQIRIVTSGIQKIEAIIASAESDEIYKKGSDFLDGLAVDSESREEEQ